MTTGRSLFKVPPVRRPKGFLRKRIPGTVGGDRPLGGDMKRTAATLALLAGFGGGCMSPNGGKKEPVGGFGTVHTGEQLKQYQGPNGEPIIAARGASPSGVVQA